MKNFYTQFKLWMMALVAMFAVSTSAFAGTDPGVSFDFSADRSNYSAEDGGMVWSKGGVKLVTCTTYDGYVVISANATTEINNEWIKLFSTSNIEKVVFHGAKDLVVDGHALVEGDTWTGSATELYVYSDSYDVQVTGVDVYFGEGLENNYAPEEEEGDIPTEPQEVATSLQWGTAVVMDLPKAMKGNWNWNSEMEGVSVVDPNGNPCNIAAGWATNGQEVVYLELASEPTVGGKYTASIAANVIPGLKYAIFGHFNVEGKEVGPEPEPEPEPEALTFTFTDNEDGTITITPSDNTRTYFYSVFSDAINESEGWATDEEGIKEDVQYITEASEVHTGEITIDPAEWVATWYDETTYEYVSGDYRLLAIEVAAEEEGYVAVGEPTSHAYTYTAEEPEPEVMEIVSVALVNGEDVYDLAKAAPSVEASQLLNVELSKLPAEGETVTYSLQAYESVVGELDTTWEPLGEPVVGEFHPLATMEEVVWQANLEQVYYQGLKYTLTISVGEVSADYEIYGATVLQDVLAFEAYDEPEDELNAQADLLKGEVALEGVTFLAAQFSGSLAVDKVEFTISELVPVVGAESTQWDVVEDTQVVLPGELFVTGAWVAGPEERYVFVEGHKYEVKVVAYAAEEAVAEYTSYVNGLTVSEEPSHFLSVVLANDNDEIELTKGDASVESSTSLYVKLCYELADVEAVSYSLQTLELVQGEESSTWAPVGEPVVGELVPANEGTMEENVWFAELDQVYAQGTKYALTLTAGEATETFEFNGATVSEDPVGPDPYVPEEGEEIVTFDFANALYNGVPYSEASESNEYYTWYTWKKGDVMTVEGHPGYTITSEYETEISQTEGIMDYAGLSCKSYRDGKMTVAVPAGMMFKKMEIHDENAKWGYAGPDYNEFTAIEKGIIVREFEAGVNSVLLTPQSSNGFVTSVVIYAIPNTTGIDTVLATTATEIYNLAGVRVRSAKGLNIVNGKKVIK